MLHSQTTLILAALLFLVLPLLMWWATAGLRSHALAWWCAGSLFVGTAIVLMGMRPWLAVWISYHASNTLLLDGMVFWAQALGVMQGRGWPLHWVGLAVLTGALFYTVLFSMFTPNTRGMGMRSALGALAWLTAWRALRIARDTPSPNMVGIALCYGVLGLGFWLHVLMLGGSIAQPDPFSDTWDASVIAGMALLTSAVAHFAFTGLILDTSTRAQVQSVRERTASEHSARLETQMHLMDRQDRLALVSGAMTQELNQPLSTALTQLQTLRQTLGSNLAPPETWNTGLELARLQVRRASVMLDQIRSLARPHSGVRMDRLDLQEVVQATADLMRAEWRGQAIQVELVLQDQPLWCQGDEVALSHVLLNLLRNATQAVQGAPQRRLKVQTLATQHEVTVLVHDSGPGLPLEALARWGEPLRTTRKHPAGLAFELALSAPSSGSTRAG